MKRLIYFPYKKYDLSLFSVLRLIRLFFQLAVDSPDTRLTIREERCYATPTQDPDDDMKYDIIRDRYIVAMLLSSAPPLVSIALTIV